MANLVHVWMFILLATIMAEVSYGHLCIRCGRESTNKAKDGFRGETSKQLIRDALPRAQKELGTIRRELTGLANQGMKDIRRDSEEQHKIYDMRSYNRNEDAQ